MLSSHTSRTKTEVISNKKRHLPHPPGPHAENIWGEAVQWREHCSRAPHFGFWVKKFSFSKSPSAELALILLRVRYNIYKILSEQY